MPQQVKNWLQGGLQVKQWQSGTLTKAQEASDRNKDRVDRRPEEHGQVEQEARRKVAKADSSQVLPCKCLRLVSQLMFPSANVHCLPCQCLLSSSTHCTCMSCTPYVIRREILNISPKIFNFCNPDFFKLFPNFDRFRITPCNFNTYSASQARPAILGIFITPSIFKTYLIASNSILAKSGRNS